MHDIFNHEDEIAELTNKLKTYTMEENDYDRCAEIFQVLESTAKHIADDIMKQWETQVKDAPASYFEKFRLEGELNRIWIESERIAKTCSKLRRSFQYDKKSSADLYETLDKQTNNMVKQLNRIKQTLSPSTKKITRKKGWKARKYKSGKAQEQAENNETEQEYYPWFSNNTLGYSLNDEQT